jgi:dTDP-4-dehydrorhamnose 3,5-epimerase
MKTTETGINGLLIIEPKVFYDNRGYFFESFNQEELLEAGISFNPVQDNESRSSFGVIRGLHYQMNPFAQAKLIRVVEGKIFDIALDLRRDSPSFGKWFGTELDSDKKMQLFIPRGFAHGFSVLSQVAVIQYKCDNYYRPEMGRGISFDDPALGIDWKIDASRAIISEKDRKNPVLRDAEINY